MNLEKAFKNPEKWKIAGTDDPCTGCGECCLQYPCPLAGGHNPCLSLERRDGRYWCRLVELNIPDIAEYLLVGQGCGATFIPSSFVGREKPK